MNLSIRKMTEEDLEPLYLLLSDSRVMKYLEPPFSKERTARFLRECGLCGKPLVWSVDNEDGFIGYVIFHDYDESSLEIGWVLYPEYWGKGCASELARRMIVRGRALGKQLVIECDREQGAAKRIAQKNGFAFEGMSGGLEVYRLKESSGFSPV